MYLRTVCHFDPSHFVDRENDENCIDVSSEGNEVPVSRYQTSEVTCQPGNYVTGGKRANAGGVLVHMFDYLAYWPFVVPSSIVSILQSPDYLRNCTCQTLPLQNFVFAHLCSNSYHLRRTHITTSTRYAHHQPDRATLGRSCNTTRKPQSNSARHGADGLHQWEHM